MFYYTWGKTVSLQDQVLANKNFNLSTKMCQDALSFYPDNFIILRCYALALTNLAVLEIKTRPLPSSHPLVMSANDYFLKALLCNLSDSHSFLCYGHFLELLGEEYYTECEDYYLRSLEIDPNNCLALKEYSRFLQNKNPEEAKLFEDRLDRLAISENIPFITESLFMLFEEKKREKEMEEKSFILKKSIELQMKHDTHPGIVSVTEGIQRMKSFKEKLSKSFSTSGSSDSDDSGSVSSSTSSSEEEEESSTVFNGSVDDIKSEGVSSFVVCSGSPSPQCAPREDPQRVAPHNDHHPQDAQDEQRAVLPALASIESIASITSITSTAPCAVVDMQEFRAMINSPKIEKEKQQSINNKAQPTQSTQPSQPSQPLQPLQPLQPSQPSQPLQPLQPLQPPKSSQVRFKETASTQLHSNKEKTNETKKEPSFPSLPKKQQSLPKLATSKTTDHLNSGSPQMSSSLFTSSFVPAHRKAKTLVALPSIATADNGDTRDRKPRAMSATQRNSKEATEKLGKTSTTSEIKGTVRK
eukprot:TRINITY_DN987_c1_g2_i2.p1 TRINITY_DN987_c1_g2~~TRINITY_DN987_c1_g2_i2.p1  ORF type:complete len:527 (-),score=136.11 TRINITY_DN987_c1_g2_i2:8-1588(-)